VRCGHGCVASSKADCERQEHEEKEAHLLLRVRPANHSRQRSRVAGVKDDLSTHSQTAREGANSEAPFA
jgi:hypothetical protein